MQPVKNKTKKHREVEVGHGTTLRVIGLNRERDRGGREGEKVRVNCLHVR